MDCASIESHVGTFYGGSQAQMAAADAALAPARDLARPWELLMALRAQGASTPTIMWCAALIDGWIRRRWKWLAMEERAACKAALAPIVIAASAVAADTKEGEICAAKLEGMLVQLLKQDWPEGWPDFLPSLAATGLPPTATLRILLLVGEEALTHGGSARATAVRGALAGQFAPVLELCQQSLSAAIAAPAASLPPGALSLAQMSLRLLARYAAWLPADAVLSPTLLAPLTPLLTPHGTRGAALQLVGVIAALPTPATATAAAAHAEALRAAMPALQDSLSVERLAVTGASPGWTESQLAEAATSLGAVWRQARQALMRAATGGETLGIALTLIAAMSDGLAHSSEPEAVKLGVELAVALATAEEVPSPPPPQLVEARAASVRFLCQRMPRPPMVLIWADDGEDDQSDWWDEHMYVYAHVCICTCMYMRRMTSRTGGTSCHPRPPSRSRPHPGPRPRSRPRPRPRPHPHPRPHRHAGGTHARPAAGRVAIKTMMRGR